MPRVFLDASVLLAATGSRSGGSTLAIQLLLGAEQYESFTSNEVEREARRNLRLKFGRLARIRFEALIGELMPTRADLSGLPALSDVPASVAPKGHRGLRGRGGDNLPDVGPPAPADRRCPPVGIRHGLRFLSPGEFLAWDRSGDQGVT